MPNCPVCKTALNKVSYPIGSLLNRDQWMSCRAGDWYCPSCPDNKRGNPGYHYFWNTELPELSQCEFCKVYEGERHESFCTPNYRQARQFEIQLAALQEQMAVANAIIVRYQNFTRRIHTIKSIPKTEFPEPLCRIDDDAQAFLTSTPTGLVAVNMKDLETLFNNLDYVCQGGINAYRNLKAALEAAQKEKGGEKKC